MRLFFLVLLPLCWASCPTDIKCDETFQKCYKYVAQFESYFSAEENCIQNFDGHLASIHNSFENAVIGETAESMFAGYNDYWIGANIGDNNGWSWTDGSSWGYTDWFPGEPSDNIACSVLLKSHKWTTSDPDVEKPYVCEIPYSAAGSTVQAAPSHTCPKVTCPTVPTTRVPTAAPCPAPAHIPYCDSTWTYYAITNSCYKVGFAQDFSSAESICVESDAHLTSIHSDEENNFVSLLASTGHPVSDYDCTWIGLTRLAGQWTWTDGTALDYRLWGPVPEYNIDYPADCTRIYTDGSNGGTGWNNRWQTNYCSRTIRNYVCKKPAH